MSATARPGPSVFAILSARVRHGTKAYDVLAALPVILFYVFSLRYAASDLIQTFQQNPDHRGDFVFALTVLSKISQFGFGLLLIVLLIGRRVPLAGHRDLVPRFFAMLGSYLGIVLIVLPLHTGNSPMLTFTTALICFGALFSVWSLAWLGRSFSMIPESRKLVSTGPYSLVRHPLYLGELAVMAGVVLQHMSAWAVVALVLQIGSQLYRMNYEEDILGQSFPEYADYKARTNRLIPWLY